MSNKLTSPELTRLYHVRTSVQNRLHQTDVLIEEEIRRLQANEQEAQEERMLRYLKDLGWEKSRYDTAAEGTARPVRKVVIATARREMVPEDKVQDWLLGNTDFVQTTLYAGRGAYNVLVAAMQQWEGLPMPQPLSGADA